MIRRTVAPVFAVGLTVLAFAGASAALQGCKAAHCTPREPNQPSPAVECPSGQLCYQGECQPTCNAGAEEAPSNRCDSTKPTCSSPRPYCVDGFCSACPEGQRCIADLNICAAFVASDDASEVEAGLTVKTIAQSPLDGGYIDGSPFAHNVSEMMGPVMGLDQPTHIGLIDIAVLNPSGAFSSTASFTVFAVPPNGHYFHGDEPIQNNSTSGPCGIFEPERIEPPGPRVDMGNLDVKGTTPNNGLRFTDLPFAFMNGDYALPGPLDQNLRNPFTMPVLVFSSTGAQPNEITLNGLGMPGITDGAWPVSGSLDSYPTVVEFQVDGTTQAILQPGLAVKPFGQNADIEFKWTGTAITDYRVVLRSQFQTAAGRPMWLHCISEDFGSLVLDHSLLDLLAGFGIPSGQVPLYFERSYSVGVLINSVTGTNPTLVKMTFRNRHTLTGNLIFP
jgi:hypothetical protein